MSNAAKIVDHIGDIVKEPPEAPTGAFESVGVYELGDSQGIRELRQPQWEALKDQMECVRRVSL